MKSVKARFVTHEVTNQPSRLQGYNLWESDRALREAVEREGGIWAEAQLREFGALAGDQLMALGFLANEHRPRLRSFDAHGRRLDEVEFHPAYHEILRHKMGAGVHNFSWRHAAQPGAHVVRAALLYLGGQADAGSDCPLTMTHAAAATLGEAPVLAKTWLPRLMGQDYDPRAVPAEHKTACTIGMGMTEKQGGSDVRTNATTAFPQSDGSHELVGHKWFFSAPMCDAHLVLAQTDQGLSCFLMPRLLPDGSRNAVRLERLKNKLGDWSNASAEVELLGASAYLVGDEGRGVAAILKMVALTRLDCLVESAALMRQAITQALHHVSQRKAFGKLLIEQALMRNVLSDMALECEAATALALRVARAVDASERDPHEAAFARIATAIGKYWVCKRCPPLVSEALECLGGIGYVEESNLARLYRQAPLNSIWEGSSNVQCLDALRTIRSEPEALDALLAELRRARGRQKRLDQEADRLADTLRDEASLEGSSRSIIERSALALQAAILLGAGDSAVAETFCRTRLGDGRGVTFGTLPTDAPFDALIARAMPAP